MMERTDVLIVGGGMVGAVCAALLDQAGFKTAIVEKHPVNRAWQASDEGLRVSAITRASQQVLTNAGAWGRIQGKRVSPFQGMYVWDSRGDGAIEFDSEELGESVLGHIIENDVIRYSLWESFSDRLTVITESVTSIDEEADGVKVAFDNGQAIEADLLVAADGANSFVREYFRMPVRGWQYEQHGVVATVQTEKPHLGVAWQRFLSSGPLAFLPLSDGRCSIVWSTSPEQATQLQAMDDKAFRDALAEAFDFRLGAVSHTTERMAFPLRLMHVEQYVRPRIALIGDAAHVIHPLAGQGVNLGIMDAASLVEVLIEARQKKRNIGNYDVLRKYERWRKGQNWIMAATMDAFKRAFGVDDLPLTRLRNLGMCLVNQVTPVKHLVMRRAMGLQGDLPKAALRQSP